MTDNLDLFSPAHLPKATHNLFYVMHNQSFGNALKSYNPDVGFNTVAVLGLQFSILDLKNRNIMFDTLSDLTKEDHTS